MVRMVPRSIQFRRSNAEVHLFSMLKRSLPDPYTVLHHVRWIRKRPGDRARDGESDFVIVHPSKGALVLEVKGGAMRYDADEGQWWSRSRDGTEHCDKDPFDQARQAMYDLMGFADDLPGWPPGWGPFGYAVCFPEARFPSSAQALPHTDPAIVIDERDANEPDRLRERLEAVFGYWTAEAKGRPDERGGRMLVDRLAHDVEIRQPLAVAVDEADREIVRLSKQQYRVLDVLVGAPRVSVRGPAGSGKTLIAAEKARRLAAQGMRVLFTCFKRPLADHLKEALAGVERVDVFGFHQLCTALTKEANVRPRSSSNAGAEYFERALPEALGEAAAMLGPRYDAIVADEARDFDATWWLPLLTLLETRTRACSTCSATTTRRSTGRPAVCPTGCWRRGSARTGGTAIRSSTWSSASTRANRFRSQGRTGRRSTGRRWRPARFGANWVAFCVG